MADRPDITASDHLAILIALSTARVEPLTRMEWGFWTGAMGDAQSVTFEDREVLHDVMTRLGISHWLSENDDPDEDRVFIILDEGGLTFNGWEPGGGGYVGAVTLSLATSSWEDVPERDPVEDLRIEITRLYMLHRALLNGFPVQPVEIPSSRQDLRDYYGRIANGVVPRPDWVDRAEKIQFKIHDPEYPDQ
jgi:hypothetical protein